MSGRIRIRAVALLTILAITGTLTSCGRYGRPVRPSPEPAEQGAARFEPSGGGLEVRRTNRVAARS